MSKQRKLSRAEQLHGLAAFLPAFTSRDFTFGEWSSDSWPGVPPDYRMSDAAASFVKAAYDLGWVLTDFDWGEWQHTLEAARLRDNADAISSANADQLAKLLTMFIRGDRFSEGALASAFHAGVLTGIIRRAAEFAKTVQ